MHDLVIRGGTIVDGTGKARFTGDLAIDAGRIAQVGGKAGPGKREIDADGQLVTPGWVDIHTHYDGQATWDPVLAPSSWHGATTLLMGNCVLNYNLRTAPFIYFRPLTAVLGLIIQTPYFTTPPLFLLHRELPLLLAFINQQML